MAKRNSSDPSPLAHYWAPPAGRIGAGGGAGKPTDCLATTYEFDAGFFESELLPRFLGLRFDHTENEPAFLVEREDALCEASVAVLVDHSRFDPKQTTMRWHQLPVHVPGGILHAKIAVLAWENFVRVIVGSANLNPSGYRRNRELFAALDFWNDPEKSVPLGLLDDVLDVLQLALMWTRAAPGVQERVSKSIDRVRRTARQWMDAPKVFTPRQRPRISLAVTRPAADRSPARSAIDEVLSAWGNRRALSVCVVSPFVGQHKPGDSSDAVIERLLEVLRSRECEGWLVVPQLPKDEDERKPRVPISDVFGRRWTMAFGPPRAAYVLPLPLCVEQAENRNRDLHSKAILLEGEQDVLLMIGSSNFTPHGMGVGAHNLEANLIVEDRSNERRGGIALADRLQLPLDWDSGLAPDDVIWQDDAMSPENDPDQTEFLPPFFAWATYSQITGVLTVELDRSQPEPARWSLRLPASTGGTDFRLFSHDDGPIAAEKLPLTLTFPQDARGVTIVALAVDWTDAEGHTHPARLAVCAESADSLLPPGEFQHLTAGSIIECLISGLPPSVWIERQRNRPGPAKEKEDGKDSVHAVDTSGYLLYRVRQFGRAITGMCDRIVRTLPRADAIRYRLLRDPFGPLLLANAIVTPADGDAHGWCSRLETEHRVFLLAEIVLAVGHVRQRFRESTRGKERKELLACFHEAETALADLLDQELRHTGAETPTNLASYVATVRSQISQQSAESAEEVDDAG
jgi:hypothetical protein